MRKQTALWPAWTRTWPQSSESCTVLTVCTTYSFSTTNMLARLKYFVALQGLGAFTSPFVSTYFSKFPDRKWAYHFIFSAVFAMINLAALVYVFRFRRQESTIFSAHRQSGQRWYLFVVSLEVLLDGGQKPKEEPGPEQRQHWGDSYRQIFALKCVPLLAAFALIYIGVEATIGGEYQTRKLMQPCDPLVKDGV